MSLASIWGAIFSAWPETFGSPQHGRNILPLDVWLEALACFVFGGLGLCCVVNKWVSSVQRFPGFDGFFSKVFLGFPSNRERASTRRLIRLLSATLRRFLLGAASFWFFICFWQRIRSKLCGAKMVFLDKLCIAQHDEEMKKTLGLAKGEQNKWHCSSFASDTYLGHENNHPTDNCLFSIG